LPEDGEFNDLLDAYVEALQEGMTTEELAIAEQQLLNRWRFEPTDLLAAFRVADLLTSVAASVAPSRFDEIGIAHRLMEGER